ncbi:nucleotidyltransferase domain-containing protein [Desulfitobacterium hafniense]|uniref:Predicted nucleotidyltransferase n=2 Tax=Desulfitobacterium hafniense TaxID=49338 RepID=A0A098B3F9_DESHA|nr:nucleotidyltransferase domain-containing protein [Desulfitobacterium hafniense]EHL04724.1 hypothetical protein HMPREF0322_04610 [Desulfitobacterium hafniense DP7]CDX02915.1 Predicted nucleotidyltransferase [Desulfitobacterium hafniense]
MKERIIGELAQIEIEKQVKILYACESGSRAWGFPSVDSDYDVRFIYVHPVEWYLSIADKRDVIEKIDGLLDLSGWELRKALRLFRKSNPALLEWLQSPVVYWEATVIPTMMKEMTDKTFSSRSSLYHYLNMARGNFREYLQGEWVKSKKYFYVLRPILACMWIEEYHTVPPMEFKVLLNALLPEGQLKNAIQDLLRRKRAGDELTAEPRIGVINDFINRQLEHFQTLLEGEEGIVPVGEQEFDGLFRRALKESWGQYL